MAQYVLQSNGKVVPRRTCRRLTTSEINSPAEIEMRRQFDVSIKEKLGDSQSLPPSPLSLGCNVILAAQSELK